MIYEKIRKASLAYPKRDYGEPLNTEILKKRKAVNRRLKKAGFERKISFLQERRPSDRCNRGTSLYLHGIPGLCFPHTVYGVKMPESMREKRRFFQVEGQEKLDFGRSGSCFVRRS